MPGSRASLWQAVIMARRLAPIVLAASAALVSFFFAGPSSARTPRFPDASVIRGSTAAGYPYINGGISSEERRAMERLAAPYNLKLVFSRANGIPASQALLVIGTNHSRRVERIAVRAPHFYIKLPPGAYTIMAFVNGKGLLIRNVFVAEGGQRTIFLRGK